MKAYQIPSQKWSVVLQERCAVFLSIEPFFWRTAVIFFIIFPIYTRPMYVHIVIFLVVTRMILRTNTHADSDIYTSHIHSVRFKKTKCFGKADMKKKKKFFMCKKYIYDEKKETYHTHYHSAAN